MSSAFSLKAFLVLTQAGQRLACKYTQTALTSSKFSTPENQTAFEHSLVGKLASRAVEKKTEQIIEIDERIIYYFENNIYIMFVCTEESNEILISEQISFIVAMLTKLCSNKISVNACTQVLGAIQTLADELVNCSFYTYLRHNELEKRILKLNA